MATQVNVQKTHSLYPQQKRDVKSDSLLDDLANSLSQSKIVSPFEELVQTSFHASRKEMPVKDAAPREGRRQTSNHKTKIQDKEVSLKSQQSSKQDTAPRSAPSERKIKDFPRESETASLIVLLNGSETGQNLPVVAQPEMLMAKAVAEHNQSQTIGEKVVSFETGQQLLPTLNQKNQIVTAAQGPNVTEMQPEKVQFELINAPISYETPATSSPLHMGTPMIVEQKGEGEIKLSSETTGAKPIQVSTGQTVQTQTPQVMMQNGQQQQQFSGQSDESSQDNELFMQGIQEKGGGVRDAGKVGSFKAIDVSQGEKVRAIQEFTKQMKAALQKGETHMIVHLRPDDLGAVDIKVDITKDGTVSVLFKTEQRETMELLSRYADQFQQVFQDAGLNADMAGMNFSSSQQQDQNASPSPKATPVTNNINEDVVMMPQRKMTTGLDIQV